MAAAKDTRIAVLGAGPMGLAVAYQLALEGYRPVVFEADDRAGGMTASFDFGGMQIERYYHFHCTSDFAFLQVLQELGLADKMHWVETRMGYWHQGRLQPWGNPAALLAFRGLGWPAKLRYGLHVFLSTRRENWHALDKHEATDWIRRWVGDEAYDVLWRKLFELKFHEHAHALSAAWIWSRIRRIGRSRYSLFKEKLGYLEGGSTTFIDAMTQAITARGGDVRLKHPVRRVLLEGQRVAGVDTAAGVEAYDRVISTIPLSQVPRVMPDLPPDLLVRYQRMKSIAVVCVIAKLRRSVTQNFWLNTNDPAMDIPGLVEYTNLRPMHHHIVYAPFYLPRTHPDYADPDSVFLDKVRRYLKTINPALRDEDFIDIRAHRYGHAQPVCGPGHLDTLPPAALPIAGLWVADTNHYYPEDRGISESIAFGRKLASEAVA